MENIIRITIFSMLFFLTSNQFSFASEDSKNLKSRYEILIINSNYEGNKWEKEIRDGLIKSLSDSKDYTFNIKTEYLDFKNKDDKEYISSIEYMIEKKYPRGSIDLVYTVGEEANDFIRGRIYNNDSSFYKIPLVFSGVSSKKNMELNKEILINGIYSEHDVFELINLILDINPHVKNINLITDDSLYTKHVNTELINLTNKLLKKDMTVTNISSNYIEDIQAQLLKNGNKSESVNMVSGEFKHKESNLYLDPKDTIEVIKEINSFPIYSNDSAYYNQGVIGGCIDNGKDQGRAIGKLIIDMLDGKESIKKYPIREPKPYKYIDYKVLEEYGFSGYKISSDINIVNKKFYQTLLPKPVEEFLYVGSITVIIIIIMGYKEYSRNKKMKMLEDELKKQKEERDNLKSGFIVNLSHELRTPINIIMNTSKIMKMKVSNSNERNCEVIEDSIDIINNNSYRLLKIANNIIDIASAESGLFNARLVNSNIVDIVEKAFESSLEFGKIKNIDMIFDTDEEEIITAIDIVQMQRVVLNILSNAIKFTKTGGKIFLNIYRKDDQVEISIKDTGIGIEKDEVDKIFNRFYQIDYSTTRGSEGSGIGLCIVKDIVEIHNGSIDVDSKIGVGTTFIVKIPIKEVELSDAGKFIECDINTIACVEMSDII